MPETCWAHNKWNKIASDIELVFHSSTIAMMHDPINIRFTLQLHQTDCKAIPHSWLLSNLYGIHRQLKKLTSIPSWTDTSITRPVINAGGPIAARACRTCVIFILATNTGIIIRTRTVETRTEVLATSSVHARVAYAAFRCGLAVFSICTWRATANKAYVFNATGRRST
jgi:hypothetical protein